MSLWVLSRSENDLQGQPAASSERGDRPQPAATSTTTALALVVLGIGGERDCARVFAERALGDALQSHSPVEALSRLLDELRRFRWATSRENLQAALRGSDGSFGAVQSAPALTFSADALVAAVRSHGVIDGQSARFAGLLGPSGRRAELDGGAPIAECEPSDAHGLRGPAAALLRSSSGLFFGGLIEVAGPNDAGLVPAITQYGVSLAMGESGGVVLVSDCPGVPDAAFAERAYAQLGRAPVTPAAPSGGCQLGHALITRDDAWIASTASLAWASASPKGDTVRRSTAGHSAHAAHDAGSAPPERGVTP